MVLVDEDQDGAETPRAGATSTWDRRAGVCGYRCPYCYLLAPRHVVWNMQDGGGINMAHKKRSQIYGRIRKVAGALAEVDPEAVQTLHMWFVDGVCAGRRG